MSHAESSPEASSSTLPEEDWASVRDPNERRKIQNRIAQRKFREKVRLQREESERREVNQQRAGAAYTAPEPDEVDTGDESGLPWGSLSFRHVVAKGKAKEQSSRETSLYAATSKTGGSSRIGLHLIDQYAYPAWAQWRSRILPFGQPQQTPQAWSSAPT